MAGFRNLLVPQEATKTRPAPRLVPLPPEAFADTWTGRPKIGGKVTVGLRLISAADHQDVRAEASRKAVRAYPDNDALREDAFLDNFGREVLGRALCQPEDASLPFWEVQLDAVFVALTTSGVRLLCEEYELLHAANNPLETEPTDDELAELGAAIATGNVWAALPFEKARKARRLLGYVRALMLG